MAILQTFLRPFCTALRWKNKIGNLYVIGKYRGSYLSVGPHWPGLLAIIAMIIGGTHINLNVLSEKLFTEKAFIWWKILIYTMAILTTIFLMLTALTDPGVMLSNQVLDDESIDRSSSINLENDSIPNSTDYDYCHICEIVQMKNLSIYHCSDCDVCIRGHDHHCPWMSKCIGQYNMRYFIIFNIIWVIYVAELLILAFWF